MAFRHSIWFVNHRIETCHKLALNDERPSSDDWMTEQIGLNGVYDAHFRAQSFVNGHHGCSFRCAFTSFLFDGTHPTASCFRSQSLLKQAQTTRPPSTRAQRDSYQIKATIKKKFLIQPKMTGVCFQNEFHCDSGNSPPNRTTSGGLL